MKTVSRFELERFLNNEDKARLLEARSNSNDWLYHDEFGDEDTAMQLLTNTSGISTSLSSEVLPSKEYYGFNYFEDDDKLFKINIPETYKFENATKLLDHIEYDRLLYKNINPEELSDEKYVNSLVQRIVPKLPHKKRCLILADSNSLEGYTNRELFDKIRRAINYNNNVEFVIDETTHFGKRIVDLTLIDKMQYKGFQTMDIVNNKVIRFDFKQILRVLNRMLNYTQQAEKAGVIIINTGRSSVLTAKAYAWAERVGIPVKFIDLD